MSLDIKKKINFLASWDIQRVNRLREEGLQEIDTSLLDKYLPDFHARLTHAVGQELLKIEKEYGVVILDKDGYFMQPDYLTICIPIQNDLKRMEYEDE